MVPVWAAWNSPGLACWAPVNAPRSKPKSSDSMSVSGMAAQLTATKGRAARGPWRCRRFATSPLPAPVSPDSSTAGNRPVPAAPRRSRRMLARRVSMAGLAPSNTSGALIRAVSYLSLRVGHPARSGAEDAAGGPSKHVFEVSLRGDWIDLDHVSHWPFPPLGFWNRPRLGKTLGALAEPSA